MNESFSAGRGEKLKLYRKKKKLTLEQLALRTELSASYISKIERGLVSPSAEAIQKLAYALDLTANELVLPGSAREEDAPAAAPRDSYIIHKADRSLIYEFGATLSFESLLEECRDFKVNVLTFPGKTKEGMRSVHSYDEFGIVARGILQLTLEDGRVLEVHEGEGVMIRARMPHSSRCLSEGGCVSYWIEILNP